MKFKPIIILLFFLFYLPIQVLAQKNDATATIEQLEKEMYRLYPTRNVDEFMDVTERLKEASLKAGNEGLFYRAWANQAYFLFSKIDRQKGMDIAKAMNEYSKLHDSKLGIYYSSLTNANQCSSLRMEDDALKLYLNAIQYKQKHLPNVNAAPAYIGVAKIYYNRRDKEKVLEMESNAPIGLWQNLEFIGEEIESIKGRPLFIYSDGLNEAEDTHQNQFGDDHMLDILRQTKFNDARHVVELMEEEVKRHRDGADSNDDMTIMCLKALNIEY